VEPRSALRANSAIRLEDGRVLVTNAGSQELRYYDAEGRFLHQVGGDGEGPGEFRSIGPVERFGPDSLALFDYRLLRYTVLDRDGAFGRIFRLIEGERRTPRADTGRCPPASPFSIPPADGWVGWSCPREVG